MPANGGAQLGLPMPAAYLAELVWEEVLPLLREIADEIGRKQVAWELDIRRSYLDSILVESGNYETKGRILVYFILRDDKRRVLKKLAKACACEIEPERPLTAEEKLERLERRLQERWGEEGLKTIEEAYR